MLIKYNSSGTKQWTRQLGIAAKNTIGLGVAIDPTSLSVAISGYTDGNLDGNTLTGAQDAFITKYNSSGTKQWTKLIGAAAKTVASWAAAGDSNGNFYISGFTDGGLDGNGQTGTTDYFVSKYNSSGAKQWTRQLGSATKDCYAYGASVEQSTASVFVGGYTFGGLNGNTLQGGADFFISKYNTSGTLQ